MADEPTLIPSCGVIIQKDGEIETMCGEDGSNAVYLTDPETQTTVTAVVIVCDRHDKALENGETLIFLPDGGEERIIIQYAKKEE